MPPFSQCSAGKCAIITTHERRWSVEERQRDKWEPLPLSGRYTTLDLLRGFSLFGVLLVNLRCFYRVSLFDHILMCGLLLIPLLRLPAPLIAIVALAAIYLPGMLPTGPGSPPATILRAHVANATRIYSEGNFLAMFVFRWPETRELIAPLVIGAAQRTFGLMLLGVVVWRSGVIRDPQRYRFPLLALSLTAGLIGIVNTTSEVLSSSAGKPVELLPALKVLGSNVNLALAYVAGLLVWRRSPRAAAFTAPVAAAGRMAPALAAAIGIAFYALQLWWSAWWLRPMRLPDNGYAPVL